MSVTDAPGATIAPSTAASWPGAIWALDRRMRAAPMPWALKDCGDFWGIGDLSVFRAHLRL
ncbi:hypothetical protein P73_3772 [Celeribacter indicus]|uniref:Uncharacterized protein n=1 Tax=Celeribacter indicus TaxID=1208324 RepID=A0A0B5E846_9RHOB|nr:hypothetical protein P73_3772 [Celeribacter indicus]